MEYGLIFHGTRTGEYYCKNMKYRINTYISPEISIEHPSVGLASLAQSREISIEHPSVGLASLAQLHTLYYTLHTEHAYCLSYRFLNNVVINTIIEMVEMVEIIDERLGQRSVERVRNVINNLLHLVIVKYGDILLVLCISTSLRLVTILSLLVKYPV